MKTQKLWDAQHYSKEERWERHMKDAHHLGVATSIIGYFGTIIVMAVLISLGQLTSSAVVLGWCYGGLFLFPFLGSVVSFVYYMITTRHDS